MWGWVERVVFWFGVVFATGCIALSIYFLFYYHC